MYNQETMNQIEANHKHEIMTALLKSVIERNQIFEYVLEIVQKAEKEQRDLEKYELDRTDFKKEIDGAISNMEKLKKIIDVRYSRF